MCYLFSVNVVTLLFFIFAWDIPVNNGAKLEKFVGEMLVENEFEAICLVVMSEGILENICWTIIVAVVIIM